VGFSLLFNDNSEVGYCFGTTLYVSRDRLAEADAVFFDSASRFLLPVEIGDNELGQTETPLLSEASLINRRHGASFCVGRRDAERHNHH